MTLARPAVPLPGASAPGQGAAACLRRREPERRHPGSPPRSGRVSRKVLAVLIGLLFIAPFYWTVVVSLSRPGEFDSFPPVLLAALGLVELGPRVGRAAPGPAVPQHDPDRLGDTVLVLVTSSLAGFAFGVLASAAAGS